ncbi:MAG TPA: outer membrane protein transport protein [Xanthobacteraceae bacterium]|nr:outer membrane protein transport protein [Xanthobacteraceae bacterium]
MLRIRIGAALLLAAGWSGGAQAGAFLIRDQSASGFGMALAGVAAGDDLSYSFWNPAALAHARGLEFEAVATGIWPSVSVSPDAATNALVGAIGGTPTGEVEIGRDALVPAGFIAYQLTDRLTVGLSLASPFGLATAAPDNWAGQVYSRNSEIHSVNAAPMLSYRINDMLSIGAGLQIQYFKVELSQAAAVTPGAPDIALDADDWGMGVTLGVQFQPWAGTTFGLGYRSSIRHDLEGSLALPGVSYPAQAVLDTPDVLSFGVRQDISESFRLFGTIEWDNWSRLGAVPATAPDGSTLTTLQLNYRDGWLYALGAEYDVSAVLTLRAGIGYEVAPLTDANRDTRFPEVDQLILSAGLTYKYSETVSFDLSYLHSQGLGDGTVNIAPGDPRFLGLPFQASSDLAIDIVSVALNVKFDVGPAVRTR